MSVEQLSSLFTRLKDDEELLEKLKCAANLDAAVAMAQEAGFDVSKADWLSHQATQILELSDEELAGVTGGQVEEGWWDRLFGSSNGYYETYSTSV